MYELLATSHEGLGPEVLDAVRIPRLRVTLHEWDAAGAQAPVRIMAGSSTEPLRALQQELLDLGIRTQLRRVPTSASGSHRAHGSGAHPTTGSGLHGITGGHSAFPAPPIHDDVPPRRPPPVSEESGLHEFRLMMDEMDHERETRANRVAATVGLRPIHFVVLGILALLGMIFSLAIRG